MNVKHMSIIKIIADFFKNTFSKNNQNNSDNLKNLETMPAQFVRLGHYKAKSGGMSEDSIRMIRVLANDPKNPDMWILADGSRKSSYEILNNYEYMNTSHEENPPQPMNPLVIGDLGGIPEDFGTNTADPNPNVVKQTTTVPSPDIIPPTYPQPAPKVVERVIEKRVELEQQIIDKCETLEIHEYTLKITVKTNLDFEKLKTSIDILGLDKELVAHHVLQKLQQNPNNDINKMVSQAIVSSILENNPTESSTSVVSVTEHIIEQVVPEESDIISEVSSGDQEQIFYGLSGQTFNGDEEESNMDSIDDFLEHLEKNFDRLNQN